MLEYGVLFAARRSHVLRRAEEDIRSKENRRTRAGLASFCAIAPFRQGTARTAWAVLSLRSGHAATRPFPHTKESVVVSRQGEILVQASVCKIMEQKPNKTREPTAAVLSVCEGCGRCAALGLRRCRASGGCGSALRWPL